MLGFNIFGIFRGSTRNQLYRLISCISLVPFFQYYILCILGGQIAVLTSARVL
jgi:hypothetical protein